MVDTVELGTFYLLFILFLQQSQDSDSKHNPVTFWSMNWWTPLITLSIYNSKIYFSLLWSSGQIITNKSNVIALWCNFGS